MNQDPLDLLKTSIDESMASGVQARVWRQAREQSHGRRKWRLVAAVAASALAATMFSNPAMQSAATKHSFSDTTVKVRIASVATARQCESVGASTPTSSVGEQAPELTAIPMSASGYGYLTSGKLPYGHSATAVIATSSVLCTIPQSTLERLVAEVRADDLPRYLGPNLCIDLKLGVVLVLPARDESGRRLVC